MCVGMGVGVSAGRSDHASVGTRRADRAVNVNARQLGGSRVRDDLEVHVACARLEHALADLGLQD
jgi:hypothetical protein